MIKTPGWEKRPPFVAGSPFKPDGMKIPSVPTAVRFSNQLATNLYATDAPKLYDQQGQHRAS
jgi:hypothetical protein